MTVFVDADSCPVKQEIVEITSTYPVKLVFVASYSHMSNEFSSECWVYVDSDKEAADLYIMNHVHKGDITVTQDIGLASTLLAKGVFVLSPRGSSYEEKSIETALDLRYLSAKERRKGNFGKGPKAFSAKDRENFMKELSRVLSKSLMRKTETD